MWFLYLIISVLISFSYEVKAQFLIQDRKEIERIVIRAVDSHQFTNLYGLPGIGKTTLSKRIKGFLKKQGKKTYWLNWDLISIDEQIKNIVRRERFNSFKELVQSSKPFIVFIDNYTKPDLDDLKDKLKLSSIPRCVKFVITSRGRVIDANSIQVPSFTKEEAILLMLKYFPNENKNRLGNIALKLKLYPYWLTNLCIAIERSNTLSLNRLEFILQSNPKEIINMDFTKNLSADSSFGNQAISEILRELKRTDEKAYLVLGFMSLLNSKSIPLQLVHYFIGNEKEGDRIIEKLSLLPMFSRVNKKNMYITYDLHEITQKIIFETLLESDLSFILERLTETFTRFYERDFPRVSLSNEEDQFFFNHLFSVIEKVEKDLRILPLRVLAIKRSIYSGKTTHTEFKESIRVDNLYPEKIINSQSILFEYYVDWAYLYCFGHGDDHKKFQKGIEFGEKALEIATKIQDHNKIFKASTRLIWVHLYAGKIIESKLFLDKATKILPSILDPYLRKEYFFAASWYYLDSGKFKESLDLSRSGVDIDDQSKSFYVGLYLRCFKAVAEHSLGLNYEAKKTLDEALKRESLAFETNSSLARAELLQTKSMISLEESNLKLAQQEIMESLRIFDKEYGNRPYHPKAVALKQLAKILFIQEEFLEAKIIILKALDMFSELIKEGGTYDFGEALLLKSQIDLKTNDLDSFLANIKEIKSRFKGDDSLLTKIKELALSNNCEWFLGV